MSIEQKLDKIIELLTSLVPKETTISSPISIDKNFLVDPEVNTDINKHLYELAEKIPRRHPPQDMSNKEFTDKLTKVLVDSEKAIEKNKIKFPVSTTCWLFKEN